MLSISVKFWSARGIPCPPHLSIESDSEGESGVRGFVLLRNWECDSVVALMLVSPSPRRLAIRKIMARIATGEVAAQMKLALLWCGFWNPHLHVC